MPPEKLTPEERAATVVAETEVAQVAAAIRDAEREAMRDFVHAAAKMVPTSIAALLSSLAADFERRAAPSTKEDGE